MNQKLDRFHKYLKRYEKLVLAHARKFVWNDVAEDVVQETFFEFYQRMDYVQDNAVKKWLLIVCGNIAMDYLRKGGNAEECLMEPGNIMEYIEGEERSAEDIVEEMEEQKAAREFCGTALDLLYQKNSDWYYIVVDSCLLGMSSREIGEVLGIGERHINVMKHRAKMYLRRKLGKKYSEFF